MLLLMRRVGEVLRINKNVLIEIRQAKDDEVTFAIQAEKSEELNNINIEENKK
jgi:sRNA-binding carbon storage regulator CsrA